MTTKIHDPIPSLQNPGWYECVAMVNGEIQKGWGKTEEEAVCDARGRALSMERQHQKVLDERKQA